MGEAGRATARQDFDWTLVFARYQELWAELNARRRSVEGDPDTLAWLMRAPPCAPELQDPFAVFGHYPTRVIAPDTRVTLAPGFSETGFAAINRHPLFVADRLPADTVIAIANALVHIGEGGESTIADLAGERRRDGAIEWDVFEDAADPGRYRLSGKVSGNGPYAGVVVHRGWRTAKLARPPTTGHQAAAGSIPPTT
jgi:hypothetical protein